MTRSVKIAVLLGFAALPLLEIALLIRLAQIVGIWWVAAIVIVTAMIGIFIIRRVGLWVFERALSRLSSDRERFTPLFDGFLQVLAGLLLIFPGVISDVLGLVLLIPQVRHSVIKTGLLKLVALFSYQADVSRESFRATPEETAEAEPGVVIEGEYERLSEKPLKTGKSVQASRTRR